MTDLLVTVDTNIVASGIARLRTRPDAAPARFVRAWRSERFLLVQSEPLLSEIERTLAKPYFAERVLKDDRSTLQFLLEHYARITPLTVTLKGIATHPEDDLVLATAISGKAQFMVTGDHKLLALKEYQSVIIVEVHAFLALLPGLTTE